MKRGALPLNALRAFESAARLGRMTLAADELGVTHGAISRQIKELERILGLSLFQGPRNRRRPTDAAVALLGDLTPAFDMIDTAVDRAVASERRALDVSCLGTLTMRWLIPRLFDFQSANPEIDIRLTSDDGPVEPGPRAPDVAIRVGAGEWGAARVDRLFAESWGPVVSPKLLEGQARPSSGVLDGLGLLHTRTRPRAWADWSRQTGVSIALEGRVFEHFYFMLEAATAGLGVAIAPEVLARDDLRAGRLIAPHGFVPSGLDYVVLRPGPERSDAETFTRWLIATVSSQ